MRVLKKDSNRIESNQSESSTTKRSSAEECVRGRTLPYCLLRAAHREDLENSVEFEQTERKVEFLSKEVRAKIRNGRF